MTVQKIDSDDVSLEDLFSKFHVVPDYQREYIWETAQVEQLFGDILEAYSGEDGSSDSEYFIGSIVCCPGKDGLQELIDGQQRITTAYLFLCAVRDYLQELGVAPIQSLQGQIAAADIGLDGKEIFRYRLVLQYEDSRQILNRIAEGKLGQLEGGTRSIENITNAYQSILAFLRAQFKEDDIALRRYYAFVTKKVKLICIWTQSVAHALKIFETINDRGKGLDSMDLLKNLLFMQAASEDFDRLKREWKKLVDTLYEANEKPLRFLRYFIFAHFDVDRLREDEIYDWFRKNKAECGYEENPVAFVQRLLEAAKAYVNFVRGNDRTGRRNRYLANMSYLSGAARQHVILLLAARQLDSESFSELCRELENLFFAYIITRENTRDFERNFARWAPKLRQVTNADGLTRFLEDHFRPSKRALEERFRLAFDSLTEGAIQKYRMRYILGKLTQFVNEQAYGRDGAKNLGTFVNSKVHVEHILPQSPSQEALQEFGTPEEAEEWIPWLGNLSLAEEAINTSLGNKPYSEKRQVYPRSTFLLTRVLASDEHVGSNTAVNRAIESLKSYREWNADAIQDRQSTLRELAVKVWDMT